MKQPTLGAEAQLTGGHPVCNLNRRFSHLLEYGQMATEQRIPQNVPDEVLKRLGLTRERFDAMRKDHEEREARAPNVGDVAPGFTLPTLSAREQVISLPDFRDKRAVGLIFGSYT